MARDQDDLRVGQGVRLLEQIHAASIGKHQIQQDEIRLAHRELPARIPQRMCRGGREALAGNQRGHHFGSIGVVFDDQCVSHEAVSAAQGRGVRRLWDRLAASALQQSFDGDLQLGRVDRLAEMSLETGVERPPARSIAREGGHGDSGRRRLVAFARAGHALGG